MSRAQSSSNCATCSVVTVIYKIDTEIWGLPLKKLAAPKNQNFGEISDFATGRPAGRPRTTWMSQVVRDTGLTAADAWAIADDRSTWTEALRPIAGYAQQ